MVSYSLPNICEIDAQTDHCPGETQPFLVLRADRLTPRVYNDVLSGVPTKDVNSKFHRAVYVAIFHID